MARQQSTKAFFVAAALLATMAIPATALGESAERTIEGWSSTGKEVLVHLVQRGERMVDGVSQDYYFEATEVYAARDGKLLHRYKSGVASGSPPPEYESAKSAELAAKFRETSGVAPAKVSFANPNSSHRLVSLTRDEVREEQGKFRCFTRHRIALLDRERARNWTIVDGEHRGNLSARRDEASCPNVAIAPAWQPEGKQWAALLRVDDETILVTGDVTDLDDHAHADFVRTRPMIATLVPEGPQRTAWTAISRGELDGAAAAFQTVTTSDGALGLALVDAYRGDKEARKAADKAFKASDKTSWDYALRAATYLVLDDARKATRWIDDAVKKADGFESLRRIAAMFELVNLSVANQIAVHALSHPSAEGAETASAWGLLARGLLDTGEFSKAAEMLAKVEKPDRAARITAARLALDLNDRRRADELTANLVFDSPGDCTALALRGRLRAMQGANGPAAQLFEAASFCDPSLEEAAFYAADFARLSGDLPRARAGFEQYLVARLPRQGDLVREVRRQAAGNWVRRLGHQGVVLSQSSCQRSGDAYLCRGVLANTSAEPAAGVTIEVVQKKKLATQTLEEAIAPGESRPFGLRFEAKNLDGAVLRAGRNADEKSVNQTPTR